MFNPLSILIKFSFFAFCFLLHQSADATILQGGLVGDEQTSLGYDAATGELFVDAPFGTELTSVRIASALAILTGDPADHLMLPPAGFDIDEDGVIFKSTLGSSFNSLSFGKVSQAGLSQAFLLNDLDVTGSLDGGGDLGAVDLLYVVPEPSTVLLALLGVSFLTLVVHAHKDGTA